jgi:hypothetical protein
MFQQILERLRALLDESGLRPKLPLVLLLLVLVAVLLVVHRLVKWMGRPPRTVVVDPSLVIDTSTLPLPHGDGAMRVAVYHVPMRLAVVVVAPLGRDAAPPSSDSVLQILDAAVPGLGAVAATDELLVRIWPRQLSATGFAHSLARHVPLPGDKGKGSPWCLVAGRVSLGRQSFAIGLALAAAAPNNLSLVAIESEHQWLDVLRIRGA